MIALGLSLVTAVLVYKVLDSSTAKPVATEGEVIVIAKVDIPPKTRITAEMVQEARRPAEYVQPGAMRELPRVLGMMTRESIAGGEQVLERRLLIEGKQAGFAGIIPAGKRAITVATTDVTGVAGLLKAGDSVDAIVTFDQQVVGDHVSQILLQNLLVLAVNRDSDVIQDHDLKKEASKDAVALKITTVTLAVLPDDATKITLAEEKGKLRFALRPYLPEDGVSLKRPLTPTEVVGVHRSPLQGNKEQAPPPAASASAASPGGNVSAGKNLTNIPVIRGTKIE